MDIGHVSSVMELGHASLVTELGLGSSVFELGPWVLFFGSSAHGSSALGAWS